MSQLDQHPSQQLERHTTGQLHVQCRCTDMGWQPELQATCMLERILGRQWLTEQLLSPLFHRHHLVVHLCQPV